MAVERQVTFIYGLIDPRTDELRWVGKSDDPQRRLRGHMGCVTGTAPRIAWFLELRALGLKPRLTVFEECAMEDWPEAEKRWIDEMRAAGHSLLNVVAGGGGSDSSRFTDEHRQAISEGHKRSAVAKAAQARAAAAVRGIPKSPEHRAKIGAKSRGRKLSLEARAKISAARRGRPTGPRGPVTDETRANITRAQRARRERENGERDRLIHELRAQGLSWRAIGEQFGLAPQSVGAVLKKAQV